ncbi:hypothetical protein [Streptomyces sp. SID3343]|uniref:hypothetical protein n=1 Tax=Streptomyces sp. SID3343 TaxID=2690260 RepID=UPI00136E50EA|nr:hypothetical protein [Streptomyces sp. SID3343]MYW03461.1 hypothetical protein [Streptomyces sp. SID3343]
MSERAPVEALEPEDFDAFIVETQAEIRPASIKIGGEIYTLPIGVPIAFTLMTRRLSKSEDPGVMRDILVPIFGAAALDEWESTSPFASDSLGVLMRWAGANMTSPGSMTLAEAAASVEEDEAGKVPANRAAKRAAAKSSKRTKSSGKR